MAVDTKVKNGQMGAEMVNEAANKAAKEAKVVMDNMIDVSNKALEDTKPLIDAHQKLLQNSFTMWQSYTQSYADFVTEATQKTLDQSLAMRKQWLKLVESNFKKTQEMVAAEQSLVVNALESYQSQVKAASEQLSKISTPVINNK
jgi:hypothetical protein